MRLHEGPVWRVVSFDSATGEGEAASGAMHVRFSSAVPDFLEHERVFLTLRDVDTAREVWPAVAHVAFEPAELPALRALAASLSPLPARVVQQLESIPLPLEACVVRQPEVSVVVCSVTRNEYRRSGADVGVEGELCFEGLQEHLGAVSGGLLGVRAATPLERAWLERRGFSAPVPFVVSGVGRGAAPVLCTARELGWETHDWSATHALDAALDAAWLEDDLPRALQVSEAGVVELITHSGRRSGLGRAEPRHARRWAVAVEASLLGED